MFLFPFLDFDCLSRDPGRTGCFELLLLLWRELVPFLERRLMLCLRHRQDRSVADRRPRCFGLFGAIDVGSAGFALLRCERELEALALAAKKVDLFEQPIALLCDFP
jgi:hypothetical protein